MYVPERALDVDVLGGAGRLLLLLLTHNQVLPRSEIKPKFNPTLQFPPSYKFRSD